MDGQMILHIYYWDKKKGTKEKVSFLIVEKEDYKSIVKSLRYNKLKIVQISIEHRFQIQEKSE